QYSCQVGGGDPRGLQVVSDERAQRSAGATLGHAVLLADEADLRALARIVVAPEEAHLLVRALAEANAPVAGVLPVTREVEAAALGHLEGGVVLDRLRFIPLPTGYVVDRGADVRLVRGGGDAHVG